jgi:hypothetical protein
VTRVKMLEASLREAPAEKGEFDWAKVISVRVGSGTNADERWRGKRLLSAC